MNQISSTDEWIEVEPITDEFDREIGSFSRGHVDINEFCEKVNFENSSLLQKRPHMLKAHYTNVHHTWWRNVPEPGSKDRMRRIPAIPGSRGAYLVTVFYHN